MSDGEGLVEHDRNFWAPGTVRLGQTTGSTTELVLHPVPSSDPDDPLNWSTARKTTNFALVCFFVLWTFVQLDIGFTAWGPMQDELGLTVDELNYGVAFNYAGLAVGCIFIIPFVHKYGRRPVYLLSSAVQFASVVWQAKVYTAGDLYGSNLISGLGGAISETVVLITIADIFFVHQHGAMNGWYLMFTAVGAFLGPAASGYIVDSQGWRWTWWWCVIFMGINLVLVTFFFEESKYVPRVQGRDPPRGIAQPGTDVPTETPDEHGARRPVKVDPRAGQDSLERGPALVEESFTRKSYRQRLALVTPSRGPIRHHFYQPIVILFTFPAIFYTAVTYGIVLASFAIMTSVQATYLLDAPYNFGADDVGLMNIAPFIGSCIGFLIGGYLSDVSIVWLSKRNGGIYEPEMRLWLLLVSVVLLPGAILMFGIGLAQGVHWAVLAIALGLFGVNFVLAGDVALSYVTDCYQEIIGDALVSIVFVRNIVSVLVLYALTPWIDAMGVENVHIVTAAVVFVVLLSSVPLLVWGKRARVYTRKRYEKMALRQPTHRTFSEH